MSDLLLLATEATETTEATGGMDPSQIAVIILIAALAVFAVAYFLVGPGRARRGAKRRGDIPLAMRPYHSDAELETTGLERAMSWGVALSLFAALFLPLYWLVEPARIDDKIDEFYEEDVAFGRSQFQANCSSCHGTNLEGGVAPHPDPEVDAPWPAPALNNIVARYEDSDIVDDVRSFMIRTIRQGRPGTPMPAWSAEYAGPMNDQQIEAIVEYILSLQEDAVAQAQAFSGAEGETIFTENCARCHGYQAEGRVGPSLVKVFQKYGAEAGNEDSIREATEAISSIVHNGIYMPTGAMMPSWEGVLSESAIDRVISYLASIQQPALR